MKKIIIIALTVLILSMLTVVLSTCGKNDEGTPDNGIEAPAEPENNQTPTDPEDNEAPADPEDNKPSDTPDDPETPEDNEDTEDSDEVDGDGVDDEYMPDHTWSPS